MPDVNIIYNDNQASVNWSRSCTSKGLRHIQIKKNHICENILSNFIGVCHIEGKVNLADIFTKEMKDTSHFVALRGLRDLIMCSCFVP
jgi:hypothetical protein